MRTTARNQFAGSVSAIELGPVSAQLTIALRGGGEVTAAMTSAAAKRLKLKPGKEVLALIKASAVVLVADFGGWQLRGDGGRAALSPALPRGGEGLCRLSDGGRARRGVTAAEIQAMWISASSDFRPFHTICTPMLSTSSADSRSITSMPLLPIQRLTRVA